MQPTALGDADARLGLLEYAAGTAMAQRPLTDAAGEEPVLGTFGQIIAAQLREQLLREQSVAVFAALALLDAYGHALGIDVGELEADGLEKFDVQNFHAHNTVAAGW